MNNFVPKRFFGRTGYQIFVDRFCRYDEKIPFIGGRILKCWSDQVPNWKPDDDGIYRNLYFYGGNLKGITSKLDYLKSLGITLLYLSPISSTVSSHHYDVEDQTKIDTWIGDWNDFKELCQKAHSKNILICVDLVFNHFGANSNFFKNAVKDSDSEYHGWFEWSESGEPIFWFGFKDLPEANKSNAQFKKYVNYVCKTYLKNGADGIRLDLGECLPEKFLQDLRKNLKENSSDSLIVSEMWELANKKEHPQIYGDQVDSVMNYPLSDAILKWIRYGNEAHFNYVLQEINKYPFEVQNVLWNFLDSHDTPRAINMLVGNGMIESPFEGRIWDIEKNWKTSKEFDTYSFRKWEADQDHSFNMGIAIKRLKLASLIQYFQVGIPVLFYGTEASLTGYKDPFNRKPYPWDNPDYNLINFYRTLGKLRHKNLDIFCDKPIIEQAITNKTLLQVRGSEKSTLVLVVNRTEEIQANPVRNWVLDGFEPIFRIGKFSDNNSLESYGAIVYRKDYI